MDTAVHKAKVQVDYSPLHSLIRTLVKQLEALGLNWTVRRNYLAALKVKIHSEPKTVYKRRGLF